MKNLGFDMSENYGKVNFQQTEKHWFNQYGGNIIETTWNPELSAYQVIKNKFNYPNINRMPTE